MNKAQKQTKVSNEGDGYAVTTWGVTVNGEINPCLIFDSRSVAREVRNDLATCSTPGEKVNVRKLEIRVVEGR